MGYFDALASVSFKTASDGSRLFFPWGSLGRGYVIASEHDYQRLRQQTKIYHKVVAVLVLTIIIITAIRPNYFYAADATVLLLCVGSYPVWVRSLQQRLLPSGERQSVQERRTILAQTQSAAWLWLWEIAALACVGVGIVGSLISNPFNPQFISLGVVGGVCAAVYGRMLRLRRGHAGGDSSTSSKR